ncbi:c-type cytochrome [Cohnella caldifontis]|uniref:c-type cytochrome n=1 Tax=Cohnella caldifontis TaxID=3027471 RepID=UPI0023EAA97B|nr:c-type cytochrome [Cohnella sp. YIM B05605]
MKKLAAVVLIFTVFLAVTACQRNNNGAPDQTQAPAASPTGSPAGTPAASPSGAAGTVDAEAVFSKNCVACHAADLHGGVGPNLQDVGARLSAADITTRISGGGGGMPAFKGTLSDAEIQALADWLSAKKG